MKWSGPLKWRSFDLFTNWKENRIKVGDVFKKDRIENSLGGFAVMISCNYSLCFHAPTNTLPACAFQFAFYLRQIFGIYQLRSVPATNLASIHEKREWCFLFFSLSALAFRSFNAKHFSHYIETTELQTSEASQMEKFSVVIFDEGAMNIQAVSFLLDAFLIPNFIIRALAAPSQWQMKTQYTKTILKN